MKKRILCAILFFVTLSLGGCSSSENNPPSNSIAENGKETEVSEIDSKAQENTENDVKTKDAEIVIEEQVVYEKDGIKITAKELDPNGSFMGAELKFLIENETDKNITVQARNVSVNGYMVDSNMSSEVASKKKNNDSLTFLSTSLEECGITNISEMEFSFNIFNSDDWMDSFDTDMIIIKTSSADGYVQNYDDSGEVLYENNGVKIVSKGISQDDSFLGPSVILYIENNMDEGITVQARDTSINGFMVDPTLSPEINPGKKAIAKMTFLSSYIEENQIDEIETVETSFNIFYTEGWDTIVNTDPISMSF